VKKLRELGFKKLNVVEAQSTYGDTSTSGASARWPTI